MPKINTNKSMKKNFITIIAAALMLVLYQDFFMRLLNIVYPSDLIWWQEGLFLLVLTFVVILVIRWVSKK